ncbi:hypothetical protein CesoFtcFv8_021099 [Champsocephalus esox]|uniref:Uncharacterized protein n=1 Tax=Champsocephalus esox TaxID=159716 RepID=A0AAN8BC84_9TELE|nr:hypothetical protein CesoFtcFv8_021099 [Champsocephalus esox]
MHLSSPWVRAFTRKLMSKFLKPAAFRTTSLESVDLQDQENQLPDTQLGIGLTTKSTLIRLHEAVYTEYALKKLPLNDPLLPHAEFVDFRQRQNSHVDDVLYFVQRYTFFLLRTQGNRTGFRMSSCSTKC